jgi:hypothetical protein
MKVFGGTKNWRHFVRLSSIEIEASCTTISMLSSNKKAAQKEERNGSNKIQIENISRFFMSRKYQKQRFLNIKNELLHVL